MKINNTLLENKIRKILKEANKENIKSELELHDLLIEFENNVESFLKEQDEFLSNNLSGNDRLEYHDKFYKILLRLAKQW